MSSAIVVKAAAAEAAKRGINAIIRAVSSGEYADRLRENWDVVLVAPQVRHRLAAFEEAAAKAGVPVVLLAPQAYTPLGGAAVLDQALAAMGQ